MNNKLLLGIAATLFMASCSSDDIATSGSNEPQNSNEAIMVGLSQQNNGTRASLGNKNEAGEYDGTFDTENLGIYCLATNKMFGTENINWADNDNPNFKWLENVRAKAVTTTEEANRVTNLQWYDGEKRFYPMGSQYAYTFYGYCPFSNNVVRNNNDYYVDIKNLDGVTDVIWGKTYAPEGENHAYSALYFREKKNQDGEAYNAKNYLPQIVFKHKLMKFNIILKKGNGDDLDKIGIKKATLHNVATGGRLYIASLNGDKDGKFEPNWNTTTTLTLKAADDSALGEDNFLGDKEQIVVGGGFMLPVLPKNTDGSYVDNGFTENGMAKKGVFRLRVDFNKQGDTTTYKAAQYEVVPPADGWKEGYEYDIVISVSTPLEIATTGKLVPWEKGTIELQ